MTDRTQPEALRLANEFKLCNEYDSIPSMNDIAKAEAELRRLHARIAELEADHFEDKLDMVARWYMVDKDGMATLCTDREDAEQEAKDANMAWPHTAPHRAVQLVEAGTSAAELHPSPTEGMVGKWMPIETAPKDGTTVLVSPPTWQVRACSTAHYNADRYAKKPRPFWERDDALRLISISRDTPPTHWMPLPHPPTTSARSGKGE